MAGSLRELADVTASSGTGQLQKGHGVACGDGDRDGNVDLFLQMGGAVEGDRSYNILFQNPGHENHWLTLKLVGQTTNRAAIGARIRIVTAGSEPQTIHRHISSVGSFGANTLQQTIGLGSATRIALLEIQWPTSKTIHRFHDLSVDQSLEITEFATPTGNWMCCRFHGRANRILDRFLSVELTGIEVSPIAQASSEGLRNTRQAPTNTEI